MLNRDFGSSARRVGFAWDDLLQSAPTVMAFAQICFQAMIEPPDCELDSLSDEAKTLLWAAKDRGVMELKGDWEAFDSSERLLSVNVEVQDQVHWLFKRPGDPQQTMRFLEGFALLCRNHLVIHQWQREFCLTDRGFMLAAQVDDRSLAKLFEFPQRTDHGNWSNG